MNQILLSVITLLFCFKITTAQTIIRQIKPSDTDPAIATFNTDSHYVYLNPTVTSKNYLLVHLPGSFGEPKRATLFGTLAANLGFHSIGLMYPNAPTVGSFCSNSNDPDCFENVRREIVEGADYSSSVVIAPNESVLSRTKKLLMYLQANYPLENWAQYLTTGNDLNYSKIIFSGHSQGGGHAAIIAKYFPVYRTICFSSPKDWRNVTNAPPLWLSNGNWQTSASSIYAFNHELDEHNQQLIIWDSLGLSAFGNPVNIDNTAAPYTNTRQLTTNYTVPSGDDHACTIQDNKTPKVSGIPVFNEVWTYMLTNNLTTNHMLYNNFAAHNYFKVTPNPAKDQVRIELTEEDSYRLSIYNQIGSQVMEQNMQTKSMNVAIHNLKPGYYTIRVTSRHKSLVGRLIKME